jgi:hypothetical protein
MIDIANHSRFRFIFENKSRSFKQATLYKLKHI